MPIYEYECARCRRTSAQVVIGPPKKVRVACAHCGSSRTRRVMSSFSVVSSEASRLAAFDPSKPREESFYRDSRNVGLWAKKRAQQMGADLGPKFEETVEKARSGKLIKDSTQDRRARWRFGHHRRRGFRRWTRRGVGHRPRRGDYSRRALPASGGRAWTG